MVDFPSAVAVPSTSAYAPTPVNFQWLANLPNEFRQAQLQKQQLEQNQIALQQQQQQAALSQQFKNGLPQNAQGVDYRALADTLAKFGNVQGALNVLQSAPPLQSPLLSGGPQPSGDLPPASAATARPTNTVPSPQSSGGPTNSTVGTIANGAGVSAPVAQNIAKALRVDVDTPLGDEQQARATSLIRSYVQRSGSAQPNAQPKQGADQGLGRLQSAIFGQESGSGQNTQTSITGARGGMQIEPETFKKYAYAGEDIDNPQNNQAVGNRILADYWNKYKGDPARAAVAYFSGPGNVAPPGSPTPWIKDKIDPNGKSTSSYVDDVLHRMGLGALKEATTQPPNARVADSFAAFGGAPQGQVQPLPGAQPNGAQPIAPAAAQTAQIAPNVPAGQGTPVVAQPAQGGAAPAQATGLVETVPAFPLPTNPATGKPFNSAPEAIMAIDREIARLSSSASPGARGQISALENIRANIEKDSGPLIKSVGGNLVDLRTGKTLYESGGLFSPEDARLPALRLFQGDNSALQGLGRGVQRAQNIKLVYDAIRDVGAERGMNNDQIAQALTSARAAFAGQMSYQRAGGTYGMRVSAAAQEVEQALPLAVEASRNLPRGQFVPWNKLVQAWQQGTSDPAYNDFVVKNFSLINAYTRAMNPTGQPRITERLEQKADNILSKATSPQAYEVQARALWQEVTRSEQAISKARAGEVNPNAPFPMDTNKNGSAVKPPDGFELVH